MNIDKLQANIFKLYILLLPVTTIGGGYSLIGVLGKSYSLIFQIVGMLLIFINLKYEHLKMSKLIKYILLMVCLLNFSSIFMAIILNDKLGVLHGENTYRAIVGETISYFQIGIIFYYNYFYSKKISLEEIKKLLYIISIALLIIGYIQILVINIPLLGKFYDELNIGGFLIGSEKLIHMNRIALTNSEPAYMGETIGVLIFPFLLSQILVCKNKFENRCMVLLYIPVIYWSRSSSVYIAIFINFIVFIYFLCKKNIFSVMKILYFTILATLISILIISNYRVNQVKNNSIITTVEYFLIDKVQDNSNLSTAHRKSTVINNLKVFKKYPLLGIGNGNQGYFYNENLPLYAYKSKESMAIYYGAQGVVGSGAFLTGYLSSYGIFGIILLFIFIKKSLKSFRNLESNFKDFKYMYFLGIITFGILSIMSSTIVGNYIVIFILSIPLFIESNKKFN